MSKKVYIKSYRYSEAYQAALEFDGTNDYVNIPHTSKLNVQTNLAIEAWVYLYDYSDFNMILTKCIGNGTTNNTYEFRINKTSGTLQFTHYSGGFKASVTTQSVPLNTWTHVAAQKNSTDVSLLINGNKETFAGKGGTSTSNTEDVKIGARDDLANFFHGVIGEIRLWNITRLAQTIITDRNKELNGDETGLAGYWKLNEGAGTTAQDSSASPQNGTLTNFPAEPWTNDNLVPIYTTHYAGFFNNFGISSFSKSIYSGNGELTLSVPRKFDDFDEGNTIEHGNRVDVFVFDKNDNSGSKIYTGIIEEYAASIATNEVVSVRCLGLVNRLALDTYVHSGNTLTKSYSSQDPALVVRDIIDQYQIANGESISYTTTTIPTTADSVSLDLSSTTYLEALNLVTRTAGADYYWLLNNDNQVVFKKFSTTPIHYFMFGRDISSLETQNSIVDVRNSVLAWNRLPSTDGNYISKRYEKMESVFKYGRRQKRKADGRYKATTNGFDKFAENYLDIYSEPIASLRFEVIDNSYGAGYNIETIEPGDTCKILNIKPNSSITNNMLITNVEYRFDRVVVDIVDVQQFISRSLFDIRERLAEQAYTNDGPASFVQDET